MIQVLNPRITDFIAFLNEQYGTEQTVKLSVLHGYDSVTSDGSGAQGFAVYLPPTKTIMLPTDIPEEIAQTDDQEFIEDFVIHNLAHEYAHFLQDIGVLTDWTDENSLEESADNFAEKAVGEFREAEKSELPIKLKLLKLVRENPTLPIVATVNSEVVGDDDCSWWLGSIHSVEIETYTVYNDRIVLKSEAEEELFEEIYDKIYDEIEHDTIDEREIEADVEARAIETIKELNYTTAIVVHISST